MDGSLHPLLPFFGRARAEGAPLVLATVVATRGSTYRKAGAQMLIAAGGRYEGLLSGGCLEGDLADHAASVLESGEPKMVRYEHEGDDDLLWGLGLGCEGGMDVWLQRLDPARDWAPFAALADRFERGQPVRYAMVTESALRELPAGTTLLSTDEPRPAEGVSTPVTAWIASQLDVAQAGADAALVELPVPRVRIFVASLLLPTEVLLLGGGPDARPVVDFGAALGWRITVVDHRPAYADPARFPRAHRVLLARPDGLAAELPFARFEAAVVMSHHLATDLAALAVLADSAIPYVGLLGPASRRGRLLGDLGLERTARLESRLHAPVGLPLGGRDPASIALSIVAEIQSHLHGRSAPAESRGQR